MGDVVGGPWRVKCAGKSKRTGKPCENYAVRGKTVCRMHNAASQKPLDELVASAAEVRLDRLAQARQRMESLVDRAVDSVVNVMENDEARASDRLKAAEMILDRSLPKKLEVESHDQLRDLDDEIATELGEVRRVLAATGTEDSSGVTSISPEEDGDAEG